MEETKEVTKEVTEVTKEATEAGGKAAGKTYRKDFSKLGWMFLLGTLIIYGVQMGVGYLVQWLRPEWLENADIALIVQILPLYLIGMPILILLVKRLPATEPVQHSMKVWQFIVAMIMCYSLVYCSNIIGTILTTIIGLFKGGAVNNVLFDIATSTSLIVNIVIMVICAPMFEEYIFRKLIVDRTVRYGQGVAIVVSGLMFGLFHGNLSQFVYAAVLGMFLAYIYVKTGKLRYTIGMHMLVNLMGGVISVLILRGIDMDAYMDAVSSGAGTEELMEVIMASLPGWIAYLSYVLVLLMLVIAGIVLFIVFRKRFVLEKGEIQLAKGRRFSTVILNSGMIVYCLFWIVKIIQQLWA